MVLWISNWNHLENPQVFLLSRLLKFVAEMLEDMEGAAFEGTLEQEHISMLSEKKTIENLENQKKGYYHIFP